MAYEWQDEDDRDIARGMFSRDPLWVVTLNTYNNGPDEERAKLLTDEVKESERLIAEGDDAKIIAHFLVCKEWLAKYVITRHSSLDVKRSLIDYEHLVQEDMLLTVLKYSDRAILEYAKSTNRFGWIPDTFIIRLDKLEAESS